MQCLNLDFKASIGPHTMIGRSITVQNRPTRTDCSPFLGLFFEESIITRGREKKDSRTIETNFIAVSATKSFLEGTGRYESLFSCFILRWLVFCA